MLSIGFDESLCQAFLHSSNREFIATKRVESSLSLCSVRFLPLVGMVAV